MIDIIKDRMTATSSTKLRGKPDVVILLDASGSMSPHRESVVSTFNEYVQSIKDSVHTVSLYMFDSNGIREKLYRESPARVRKLSRHDYRPEAMTPLYDAMGKVMSKFDDNDRPVQFVTHTDGQENHSSEWLYPRLKEYIAILENSGWMFVYLAEGLQAQEEMKKFSGLKMEYESSNRGIAMEGLRSATAAYAATGINVASAYTKNGSDTLDFDKGDLVSAGVFDRTQTTKEADPQVAE